MHFVCALMPPLLLLLLLQATMLEQIKCDTEELLKLAFENYYLLSSNARKGIVDGSCSPPPGPSEFPPTALVAGVHLFEAMRDVFHPRDVEWLTDRFKLAAKGRWQRLAMLCDEGSQQVCVCSGVICLLVGLCLYHLLRWCCDTGCCLLA